MMERSLETLWMLRLLFIEHLCLLILLIARFNEIARSIRSIPEDKQAQVIAHLIRLDSRLAAAIAGLRQQQAAEHGEMISLLKYIQRLTHRMLTRFGFLLDAPDPIKDVKKPPPSKEH